VLADLYPSPCTGRQESPQLSNCAIPSILGSISSYELQVRLGSHSISDHNPKLFKVVCEDHKRGKPAAHCAIETPRRGSSPEPRSLPCSRGHFTATQRDTTPGALGESNSSFSVVERKSCRVNETVGSQSIPSTGSHHWCMLTTMCR